MSKIDYYENKGCNFKNTQEMNLGFITDFRYKTYQHYIHQPKSMLERTVIKNIHTYPKPEFFIFRHTDHFFAVFEIIRSRNILQQRENTQEALLL